ncbi:hypothetical protein [Hymenobacter siberiensis]|uniref:hypothetical protein n=1 Tax=Hymenobacter siberiensis TaxID=2848396 RepID=UPI001C1E44A7|nr:hypothetical protein [Hymenobacter siberiensis]
MLNSLSPKQYAQLLYYPALLLALVIVTIPTAIIKMAMAYEILPFLAGWFMQLTTVSGGMLVFLVARIHLKRWATKNAVQRRGRQLHERGMHTLADYIASTAERAEWKMLASICLLFGIQVVFVKPQAQAQMHDVERPEPRVAHVWPADKPDNQAIARQLQVELHLNKHGVIRALKYLNQGYPVSEVRNLFAATVRK